jgi:hypothetical protein
MHTNSTGWPSCALFLRTKSSRPALIGTKCVESVHFNKLGSTYCRPQPDLRTQAISTHCSDILWSQLSPLQCMTSHIPFFQPLFMSQNFPNATHTQSRRPYIHLQPELGSILVNGNGSCSELGMLTLWHESCDSMMIFVLLNIPLIVHITFTDRCQIWPANGKDIILLKWVDLPPR